MRRLMLLRHAKSSWSDPTLADQDRPLASRGERAVAALAHHLEADPPRPDLVLCSSALRARQTLAGVLPSLGAPLEVRIDPDLYTFDPDALLAAIRPTPDSVATLLVVGHNPAMEELTARLTSAGEELLGFRKRFPTGTLAVLELPAPSWQGAGPRDGRLVSFTTPRSLEDARAAEPDRA